MATKYMRNGREVTADFYHGTGPDEVLVPLDNLRVWDDATLAQYGVAKVVTPDVPNVISDRQFFQLLANRGIITAGEALAAVGPGIIPAQLEIFVGLLPEGDRFAARMVLSGATEFDRRHPLVQVFGSLFSWTPQDIDDFWTEASTL